MYSKVFIPYRGYYSSPFARWQGSLQNENAIELGGNTARRWLEEKKFDPKMFDFLYLGKTIPQHHSNFAAPWAATLMGNPDIPALHITQVCATSTIAINLSAISIEAGNYSNVFCLMTDRTSNGAHTIWANPFGPGGEVISENWNMDNFNYDPSTGSSTAQTGENVAKLIGTTKEECDAVTLRRYEQYHDAVADDRAFQKRYMFPVEFSINKKRKGILAEDEGVTPTTKEGLAQLRPVIPGGYHTFGTQTHPADGNCGIIVTTREKARELSADKKVEIQVVSFGNARAPKAHMPMGPGFATKIALARAGLTIKDMKAIKTHNPFIVNDIYLAREFGIDVMALNNYGSSVVFGHPQGPTAGRSIIELIEEVVMLGGGYGLFAGCAAGDLGAALIVKVTC